MPAATSSRSAWFGSAKISFSRNGILVYRSRDIDASREAIQWLDADGKMQPLLDKASLFVDPRLPPDGQRLVVANDDARRGVWIYDIRRDTLSPLTAKKNATHPVWTPDGKHIVYQAQEGIAWARADGSSKPTLLTESKEFQYPAAFSPDGKWLAFHQMGSQGFDLWILPVLHDADRLMAGKPELFQHTSFGERGASFSADGLPTAPTSRAVPRFGCARFPTKAAAGKSPAMVERRPSSPAMGAICFSLTSPMTGSWWSAILPGADSFVAESRACGQARVWLWP